MENDTHDNDFLRPGFVNLIMIGKSQCGKTYLVKQLIPRLSPKVRTLIIASIVRGIPHHTEIRQQWLAQRHGAVAQHDNPKTLQQQLDYYMERGEVSPSRQGVILFDDFTDTKQIRGPYFQMMVKCATTLRNLGWHMIFITQDPARLPIPVRNSSTCQILFDSYSRSNIRLFTQDIIDRIPIDDLFDMLITYIRRERFRYIMTRQYPFDVCVGKGMNYKRAVTENDVIVPTMAEIITDLDASSREEAVRMAYRLQEEAGNTSLALARLKR